MTVKSPMEVRVSADVAPSRDRWSTEGLTTILSAQLFSEKLGDFCDGIVTGLESINGRMSNYSLDAIEMHVELTSKGEVRLIAAAGAEVKGAFKLTFRARNQGQAQAENQEVERRLEQFSLQSRMRSG
jgi:hypothetical protein